MNLSELNSLSPLRAFGKEAGGDLGKGNLGVIVSRRGVGKTACLVHLATDKLLHSQHVIHVSFNGNVEHVINWYKEIFTEVSKGKSLDDVDEVYRDIIQHRMIMNFSQEDYPVEKVLSSLSLLIKQGAFQADAVMFDGYRMTLATEEDIKAIKKFAEDYQVEVWFAVSPVRSDAVIDQWGVPDTLEQYRDHLDVLIGLKYDDKSDKVLMTCVRAKGKDLEKPVSASLDPKTMLVSC